MGVILDGIRFQGGLLYAALLLLPNARGLRCHPDLFMQRMLAEARSECSAHPS